MVSWQENAARYDASFAVIVRVDGYAPHLSDAELAAADGDARFRFCCTLPDYAAAMPPVVWRRSIAMLPDVLGERAPEGGGAARLESARLGLHDTDELTAEIAPDAPAYTSLEADLAGGGALAGTAQVVTLGRTAALAGTVIHIAGEAMRVEAVLSGAMVRVTRGYANTTPLPHVRGAPVFQRMPFFEGRRMAIHLAPLDGDSAADERKIAEYRLDGVEWSTALRNWLLDGTGQLRELSRLVARTPRTLRVTSVRAGADEGIGWLVLEPLTLQRMSSHRVWFDRPDLFYLRHGAEIFTVQTPPGNVVGSSVKAARRAVAGTPRGVLEEGKAVRQVFVAEPGQGDFRFSPGPAPSTDRTSGTWIATSHWLDLILIMALSAADDGDGLELQNFVAAEGNFSSLPPGFGIGALATDVDWAAARDVYQRTADYLFPNFAFGDEAVSFGELITEAFLRPMGAYLTYAGGQVRVILPRAPLTAASVQLGPQDLLTRRAGPGVYEPRIKVRRSRATASSEIVYRLGPQGGPDVTVTAPHIRNGIGQRGEYGDPRPKVVLVAGADPTQTDLWERRGQAWMTRTSRPRVEIEADWRLGSAFDLVAGDVAGITLPELPDTFRGARGWTNVNAQVLQRTVALEAAGNGRARLSRAYISQRAIGYGTVGKLAKIAPAARVATGGVSGNDATVETNLYTEPDAAGGLPTTDAAAFAVGDVVRLVNRDGTDAAGLTEIVDGIAGDVLTLSGDFGGALADGLVIEYANANFVTATQLAAYAFYADRATRTVGSGAEAPYVYAEP